MKMEEYSRYQLNKDQYQEILDQFHHTDIEDRVEARYMVPGGKTIISFKTGSLAPRGTNIIYQYFFSLGKKTHQLVKKYIEENTGEKIRVIYSK
jgi:hypothetical protein